MAEGSTEKVNGEARRISATKLKALLKADRQGQENIDEIKGGMGKRVATHVEKDNLDKKMYGWIKQLDRMSPERLAYHWDNLMHMFDISGLSDRAKDAPKMQLGGEETDEEETDAPAGGSRKPTASAKFPAPAGATDV